MLPSDIHGSTTETVGFFHISAVELADSLHDAFGDTWQRIGQRQADLGEIAAELAPGLGPVDRYAIVDLGSGWCAVLTNGPLGTDVGVLPSWAARTLGATGVRATSVADKVAARREGGVVLEVYDPAMIETHPLACRRTLSVVNDGGRWTVEESGAPFDFEEPDQRFDGELLRRYLDALGIPAWDGRPRPVIRLERR